MNTALLVFDSAFDLNLDIILDIIRNAVTPSSFCEENPGKTFLREAGNPGRSLSGSAQMGRRHLPNNTSHSVIQLCTELGV